MTTSNVSINLAAFIVPSSVMEERKYSVMAQHAPSVYPGDAAVMPEFAAPAIAPRQFFLSEIPADDLLKMCDDFADEVFKRAGKTNPTLLTTTSK